MDDDQVKNAVAEAINSLKAEAPALEFATVHERSTAHRLAVQLEQRVTLPCSNWNVDCEYDRNEEQLQKMLMGIAECVAEKTTNGVVPDIVVHHRGFSGREHNLLVVELKKNDGFDKCDDRKLHLFTDLNGHYQYQLGLYININFGSFDCTWYKDGTRLG